MDRRAILTALAGLPLARGASAATAGGIAGDIAIVRECLLQLHPGLLRYNTMAQVEHQLDALDKAFTVAPDLAQRYLALSRFLAALKCGHSYANFFNQSKAVASALFDRRSRLPFTFRWIGDAMVVTGDPSAGDKLAPGTVIESIDGVPAARLLNALLPYTRADGHNDAKRRSLLAVRAQYRLDTFDVFHGLIYGEPPGGVFKLALRRPDGRSATVERPALTMAERHAQVPAAATARDAPTWDWRVDANGIATLTMPGWAVYNSQWDWQAWLSDRLDALSGAKGLIVDLRDNEGGLDCGNPIVERFARTDSVLPMRRLVRYRKTPAHLDPYLDTWDPSFRDWGDKAERFDERFFALPAADTTIRPRDGKRLGLPLVVLVSATNSSATFAFAQRVQAARIGTLVGEPTGGNQRGINGGAFFFVRLPASGLEFDLPLIGTFPPQPTPDAGLTPDVRVDVTAADIAAGRDAAMERALAIARAS